MKKLSFLLLIIIVLCFASCSDVVVVEGVNPPSFLKGSWVSSNMPILGFRFTDDDVLSVMGSNEQSLKDACLDDPDIFLSDSYSKGVYTVTRTYNVDPQMVEELVFEMIDIDSFNYSWIMDGQTVQTMLYIRKK